MKKTIFIVLFAVILTGCSQFNTAMGIIDIFAEPTPIHYAEVQSITNGKDKTTLFFIDGYNYEISNYIYVRPGDKVKIFEEDDGSFSAKVD